MKKNSIKIVVLSLLTALSLEAGECNLSGGDSFSLNKIVDKWNNSENALDIEAGGWYTSWTQISKSSKIINNGIKVNYNIDDTLASVVKIRGQYRLLSGSLKYYNSKNSTGEEGSVKGYSFAASALDFLPCLSAEFRLIRASFDGSINAIAPENGAKSSGTFSTEVKIADIILYPFSNYIGIGYRKYKYDFPLDMYVLENKTKNIIISGLANVEYDGHFFEVVLDNSRLNQKESKFIYSISAGVGTLDAKAEGFEQYLTSSNAKFIEAMVGYSFKHQISNVKYSINGGYRYNYLSTEYKTEGDYTMITEFSSKFTGPFLQFAIHF